MIDIKRIISVRQQYLKLASFKCDQQTIRS